MTYCREREKIKELLPLYASDRIGPDQRRQVEEACAADVVLAAELAEWQAIRHGYAELAAELPEPPPFLYTRIRERVGAIPEGGLIGRLFGNLRWTFGLAGVALLVLALFTAHHSSSYRTLSVGGHTSANQEIRVNVVFKEQTGKDEVKRLIQAVNGRIVNDATGYYVVVALPQGADADAAISVLKKSGKVSFAEKAY